MIEKRYYVLTIGLFSSLIRFLKNMASVEMFQKVPVRAPRAARSTQEEAEVYPENAVSKALKYALYSIVAVSYASGAYFGERMYNHFTGKDRAQSGHAQVEEPVGRTD